MMGDLFQGSYWIPRTLALALFEPSGKLAEAPACVCAGPFGVKESTENAYRGVGLSVL